MSTVLSHALSLAKRGFSVIPIDPGKKATPAKFGWKQYQERIMSEDEIREYIGPMGMRLGVILGAVSGHLECIDFDAPEIYTEWFDLLTQNGHEDLLAKLVIERSPRGGKHCYYRCPEGVERNQKLARRYATTEELALNPKELTKVLVETRGEGGLVVCVPTGGYVQVQHDFGKTPVITAEERAVLLHAARSFELVFNDKPSGEPKERSGNPEGKPGFDFNVRGEWRPLLEGLGWAWVCHAGGRDYWRRPGKTENGTWSATTGNGPTDLMYVHSTSCHPLEAETTYSKFAVMALCEFGGDYGLCASALYRAGYGEHSQREAPATNGYHPPISADSGQALPPDLAITVDTARSIIFATDLARAEEWVQWASPSLRYVVDRQSWITLASGDVWQEEAGKDGPAIRSSSNFGRLVGALAASELPPDAAKAKEITAAARAMESKARIETHVSLGKTIPSINLSSSQLDAHKFLVGTLSGVVDLQTGRIVDNASDKFITKHVACAYCPDAKAPNFHKFLSQVYQERAEVIELVLSLLAYSMSGDTSRQVMVLLYGERGRNGKSTLFDVMRGVLGQGYYRAIDKKLLIESGTDTARFSLAQLEGVRMATAAEASGNSKLNTEFLKALTGDGELFAERKGRDGYPFTPQAKLWLATNNLPYARFDPSFRSRLVPIPHTQSFYNETDPSYQKGDLPRIEGFEGKLLAEREGIFAGLVKAFRTIYMEKGITRPAAVRELAYQYEIANDHVSLFVSEMCELGDETTHRTQASELFRSYIDFCKRMRLPEPGRYNEFIGRMKLQDGVKNIHPQNRSTFAGISLRSVDMARSLPYRDD